MASPERHLFVDLDALVASVKLHVQSQPLKFSEQLQRIPIDDVALDPLWLTTLLESNPAIVVSRKGSYLEPLKPDADALKATGWRMRKKGAADHPTLEKMLEKAITRSGVCLDHESKTLVLATGEVPRSLLNSLEDTLQMNWRVQVFTLQRCEQTHLQQLSDTFANKLEITHIDRHVPGLLVHRDQLDSTSAASPGSQRDRSPRTTPPQRRVAAPELSAPDPPRPSVPQLIALPPKFGSRQRDRAASPPAPDAEQPSHSSHSLVADTSPRAKKESDLINYKLQMLQDTQSQYSAGSRQRFVYMDFDNVTGSVFAEKSHLYRRVPGARSKSDLFLDLDALTKRVCGDDPSLVQTPRATYYNSFPHHTKALMNRNWRVVKQETESDTTLQLELLSQLVTSTENADKTLVLVTGDGNTAANGGSFKGIVDKYLQNNWFVEIHAWLHSLNMNYIELQKKYPLRLVVRPLDTMFSDIVKLHDNARQHYVEGKRSEHPDVEELLKDMEFDERISALEEALRNMTSHDRLRALEAALERVRNASAQCECATEPILQPLEVVPSEADT